MTRPRLLFVLLALATLAQAAYTAWADYSFDREPVSYSTGPTSNPVSALQARMDAGEVTLVRDGDRGYLTTLLAKLDIPVSSQCLVFSKTSLQRDAIDPAFPRAIYFNDDTYVGFVRGGDLLEVATTDPTLGSVFYTIDQHARRASLARKTHECLQCHAGAMTRDVPGLMMRSVFTDPRGQPILSAGTKLTTHESPMEERFGGWYVTGTHGGFDVQPHRGNLIGQDRDNPDPADPRAGADITDLSKFFDSHAYPSPHSDLVALMVLGHQVQAHNLMTQAGYAGRYAIQDARILNEALGEPLDTLSESSLRRIRNPAEALLRYLLYCDEAPLAAPLAGTSAFREEFEARGPFDRQGRSLRQFDLKTRMFRYPLSYLVYSPGFDGLPKETLDYVYRRLFDILSGKVVEEPYKHISAADRQAILEILRDTKPNLPDYWLEP